MRRFFNPPPCSPSHLLSGGESIAVYPRLPRPVPPDVRPAVPGAVADTGLEGRLGEGHNSLRPEERHRLRD